MTASAMTRIAASKAQDEFADILERVVRKRERIVLRKGKRDVAALVPFDDLELLEELEDCMDIAAARKALAEAKKKGEQPIPWEKARKRLGL